MTIKDKSLGQYTIDILHNGYRLMEPDPKSNGKNTRTINTYMDMDSCLKHIVNLRVIETSNITTLKEYSDTLNNISNEIKDAFKSDDTIENATIIEEELSNTIRL